MDQSIEDVRPHKHYGGWQLNSRRSKLIANNILNVAKTLSLSDWRLYYMGVSLPLRESTVNLFKDHQL